MREFLDTPVLGIPLIWYVVAIFLACVVGLVWIAIISRRENAALVTLGSCPPGLFLFEGSMHLKTEYGEAYVCKSGEFFWGITTTHHEERANLMVLPIDAATIRASA